MKINLIANNIDWQSLNSRTEAIRQKLEGLYKPLYASLTIDITHTALNVPMPDSEGALDPSWFKSNLPLNSGYDAYILLINRAKDWKSAPLSQASLTLGQYIQSGDTLNFYIVTDEYNTTVQNDLKTYYVFEDTFEHEFAHAVYHDLKCPLKSFLSDQVYRYGTDNVHYFAYADKHNFAAMYQDIYSIDKQNFPGISPNLTSISLTITSLIKSFTAKFSQPMQNPTSTPIPATLSWDNPAGTKKLIQQLCTDNNLNNDQADIICACIEQESQFNINAINYNRNAQDQVVSTDYGICQINDYYHIGPGKDFPNAQYVLENPDKCVEYMIKCYKEGHLDWWVSYSSDAYKRYL